MNIIRYYLPMSSYVYLTIFFCILLILILLYFILSYLILSYPFTSYLSLSFLILSSSLLSSLHCYLCAAFLFVDGLWKSFFVSKLFNDIIKYIIFVNFILFYFYSSVVNCINLFIFLFSVFYFLFSVFCFLLFFSVFNFLFFVFLFSVELGPHSHCGNIFLSLETRTYLRSVFYQAFKAWI